jgi:glucosamine--fructose-6-phosphate aminotransferase (isomerizing)
VCSIIACAGYCNVVPLLADSLQLMEYRGYDSVGIAILTDGGIVVRKGVGNVDTVRREKNVDELIGSMGIGHTRWATHGVVNEINAHPHTSCDSSIVVVHNGIIDNYLELKTMLISKGHIFKSDTDSEVIVHALEDLLRSSDIKCAMLELIKLLRGSYAFVALLADGMIVGARSNEPLIIGVDYNGRVPYFIASDVLAFIRHTEKALFLSNEEFFILHMSKKSRKRKGVYTLSIYDSNGKRVKRGLTEIAWEFSSVDKGKYAHYTHKEIHEQMHTVAKAFNVEVSYEFIRTIMNARRIIVTGSGSSYHAALYAKYMLSRTGLSIDAIVASDVKYSSIGSSDVLLAVSQSGETADTLSAVKYARSKGCPILGVVNVTTSSLARSSDMYVGIDAGIERGVAATKSFTSQLVLLYRLACMISGKDHRYNVSTLINGISSILANEYHTSRVADILKDVNDAYIIGKDIGYVIALEGALKLKEIAYMHAEAIHAGEFKHGPLALIDKNSIVIALNARDYTYEDTMNGIREVKARGAYIIGVSDCSSEYYDHYLAIPSHDMDIANILYECIQLQLLAYHTAVKKNFNPDYPRNIAKSITVS